MRRQESSETSVSTGFLGGCLTCRSEYIEPQGEDTRISILLLYGNHMRGWDHSSTNEDGVYGQPLNESFFQSMSTPTRKFQPSSTVHTSSLLHARFTSMPCSACHGGQIEIFDLILANDQMQDLDRFSLLRLASFGEISWGS